MAIKTLVVVLLLVFFFFFIESNCVILSQQLYDVNQDLFSSVNDMTTSLNQIFLSPSLPLPPQPPPSRQLTLALALFVIGDSSIDCGTNNFLATFSRADRLPYGRDFDSQQPTGRFCNGRIPVDYLVAFNFNFNEKCDMYQGSMEIIKNNELYGFNVTTDACCGLGRYRGWIMCISLEIACDNSSNHIWWDQFHPIDRVNSILADNVWNGLHSNMCFPGNLEDSQI